jgi:tetratricopeptide (TPR) repeat protein
LAGALVQNRPRLLFLSACHTGEGGDTVDSLARGLVRAGFPAVLGWADAVFDRDASAFAAAFYGSLMSPGMTVQTAWAATRFDLLQRPDPPTHWHLARLFLGRTGGGALAAGTAARQHADVDAGRKAVLDAPGRRIEVASRFEFVGRRRQIQAILRAFRQPGCAGAAILGLGRQGKSSLAAHIIDRNPHLKPVVLFRTCDGLSLLAEICRQVDGATDICARYRDRIDPNRPDQYDPDALFHALRALLQGPCGHRSANGKPILLLLDDFEALLDPPSGGDLLHTVQRDVVAPLAAVIRAFEAGGTESRLLLTCRYAFRLSERGHDLAAKLRRVALPAMSPAESLKQARQKLAAAGIEGTARLARFADFQRHAIKAACGNAGLQDLLFQASLTNPDLGEAAAAALEAYLTDGTPPDRQDLRDTLEKLAIREMLSWLTAGERHLLHASTLFHLPVPLPVWRCYADRSGSVDRLLAFGLWERLPDLADRRSDAAAPNAIGVAHLGRHNDNKSKQIIELVLPDLFQAWGGADRSKAPYAADIELTRLALQCGNCDVLAATGEYAIRGQEAGFDYRAAAATASGTLDALTAAGRAPAVDLLRTAAEVFDRVGDPERLKSVYDVAPSQVGDDASLPVPERTAKAQFRGRYGGYLLQQGEPDRALQELQAARAVFETLGDRRSRAVTLGDIARILTNQGDVEQALKLHHEELQAYEALGDQDGIASANFGIGQIQLDQAIRDGDATVFHQAYDALDKSYRILLAIGRLDGICIVGATLGQVLAMGGQQEDARAVLTRSRDGFRQLGQTQAAERMEALLRELG